MRNSPVILKLMTIVGAALLAAALVGPAAANTVTFDLEPIGSTWGGAVGNSPGDLVLNEDGIDMYVEEFHLGAYTGFNYCRIEPAPAAFGTGQVLAVNNISVMFDFGGVPCAPGTVSFEFLDYGGDENLQVNGGPLWEVPDLVALDGVWVAPNVLCTVNATGVPGGIAGTVILTGPVDKMLTGGQEYMIDNVAMDCDEPSECDFLVSHDLEQLGMCWGSNYGQAPGDLAFSEDGIPVTLDLFHLGTYTGFGSACIVPTFCTMGPPQMLALSNISAVYEIHALGVSVSAVTFEFIDQGGDENLQVNGSTLHEVPSLMALDGVMVAPGVLCSVTPLSCDSGQRGLVTLTGDVQRLLVGGQEFFVDEVCVYTGEPGGCDLVVDNETQAPGMGWGGPYGDAPGAFMFAEDGIPLSIWEIYYPSGGMGYNFAAIDPAFSACLDGNTLNLNNVSVVYDIGATGVVTDAVIFDYFDLGGEENLQVNGASIYIGDMHLAPVNIAPGVTCSVSYGSVGGGICGRVTLTGDVQQLRIAGQEFWTDDLCVIVHSTSVGDTPAATRRVELDPAWPNPFNPKTNLRFSLSVDGPVRLTVHDVLGRELTTLVDGHLSAGSHEVEWNGRDAQGRSAASGIYFAKIHAAGEEVARKLVLSK